MLPRRLRWRRLFRHRIILHVHPARSTLGDPFVLLPFRLVTRQKRDEKIRAV
jgi:hypothetical protein